VRGDDLLIVCRDDLLQPFRDLAVSTVQAKLGFKRKPATNVFSGDLVISAPQMALLCL
jgi:hypothetical protein